jgi:hypothetical protein
MVLTNTLLKMGGLFMILCLAIFSTAMAQDQHTLSKKEMKELSRVFEGELMVSEVILADFPTSTRQMLREGDLIFKITEEHENRGYILSTEAKGRFDYFDYSVYFSEELVVKGLIVTVYRSTHGAAICQKKWLSQFNGYDGEELNLGKEIDAISGATFSAESMVQDIQRCFALMTGLKEEGIIQ